MIGALDRARLTLLLVILGAAAAPSALALDVPRPHRARGSFEHVRGWAGIRLGAAERDATVFLRRAGIAYERETMRAMMAGTTGPDGEETPGGCVERTMLSFTVQGWRGTVELEWDRVRRIRLAAPGSHDHSELDAFLVRLRRRYGEPRFAQPAYADGFAPLASWASDEITLTVQTWPVGDGHGVAVELVGLAR